VFFFPNYGPHQAWNSLTASNVVFQNSMDVIRAGLYIKLLPNFNIQNGCEINLALGNVIQDCSLYPSTSYPSGRIDNSEQVQQENQLIVKNVANSDLPGGFAIISSLTDNSFIIKNTTDSDFTLNVYDMLGNNIIKNIKYSDIYNNIFLSEFNAATYVVQIIDNKGMVHTYKVIKR
jgi:hypothetical protein